MSFDIGGHRKPWECEQVLEVRVLLDQEYFHAAGESIGKFLGGVDSWFRSVYRTQTWDLLRGAENSLGTEDAPT